MPATPYIAYAKTIERSGVRLHAPEIATLRHAADAVFFDEEDRDAAVAAATRLLVETLALEERLGPDLAETLIELLDAVEPILVAS